METIIKGKTYNTDSSQMVGWFKIDSERRLEIYRDEEDYFFYILDKGQWKIEPISKDKMGLIYNTMRYKLTSLEDFIRVFYLPYISKNEEDNDK